MVSAPKYATVHPSGWEQKLGPVLTRAREGADIEASLLDGRAVASNGLLHLNINDIQPGGTVTDERRELPGWVQVDIDIDGPPPEQLWIISDGVAKKLDVSAPNTTYSFKMRPAQH